MDVAIELHRDRPQAVAPLNRVKAGLGGAFGGLNQPRDDYDSPPPIDTTRFAEIPVATLLPFLDALQEPALSGSYCQRHGFTDLGEFLMTEMMKRGMIIDIAHLPQRALDRAYDMLDDNGYPATRTHGSTNDGRIYY